MYNRNHENERRTILLEISSEGNSMPKRTNTFQKLILEVKRHLAAGATVEESRMLIDQKTGAKVEVDVCIETGKTTGDTAIC